MSLETLAAEITKQAQEEAGAIQDEAKTEATRIEEEASISSNKHRHPNLVTPAAHAAACGQEAGADFR